MKNVSTTSTCVPEQFVPVLFHYEPDGLISDYTVHSVTVALEGLGETLQARVPVERVDAYLEPLHDGANEYIFTLRVQLSSALICEAQIEQFVARAKDYGFEALLHDAMHDVEAQVQHSQERIAV